MKRTYLLLSLALIVSIPAGCTEPTDQTTGGAGGSAGSDGAGGTGGQGGVGGQGGQGGQGGVGGQGGSGGSGGVGGMGGAGGQGGAGGAGGMGGMGGAGGGALTPCETYCADIAANCTGENAQYASKEICLASCAAFPEGNPDDMIGNTVHCRIYHAGASAFDPETHCTHAGPGGAAVCGTNCEGFCAIATKTCPVQHPTMAACMTECTGLPDMEKYDASDVSGDTLACRLYHATVATIDPFTHCSHTEADFNIVCM
jgi:hypothetical protein